MADGHGRIDVVYELFNELADMPLEQRCRVLRERCGDDDALYAEALEVLTLDSRMRRDGSPPAPADGMPDFRGVQIGRYVLGEKLGEGGMGIIYLAEQTKPVRRSVALKLIKPGMNSKLVLARFQAEQQALALMDHPNVAKVFDAGMTEQGRPYFVMEYVPGPPITEYCDHERLGLDGNPRFVDDPNTTDTGCGSGAIVDMGSYEFQKGIAFEANLGDIDGDEIVGINDFLDLLAAWGACPDACCLEDLNADTFVGINDFLLLLGNWS